MATKFDIPDASGRICSALSALGFEYYLEADNRGGKRASQYILVRRPKPAKIRVSDHRSNWVQKNMDRARTLLIDVGPWGVSVDEAIAKMALLVEPPQ